MSDRRKFNQTLLLLGGNQGDVMSHGDWVVERLQSKYSVEECSLWYTSPAWGFEGPDFYNRVIALKKVDDVHELLDYCLSLELQLGRERYADQGYTSRPMDIDILYHGEEVIRSEKLIIPHPKIQERRFTLLPLSEKWGNFEHPILHETQIELLNRCEDSSVVKSIAENEE